MGRPVSEVELQAAIMDALAKMGVWAIRTAVKRKRSKVGIRTGEPGMPDLWTEYGWLEVKLPGNGLDPDQVTWHQKANSRGVGAAMTTSVSESIAIIRRWRNERHDRVGR